MDNRPDIPALTPEDAVPLPQVPGYRLLSLIGAGPQASVYRAVQLCLEREVALKVLSPRLSGFAEYVEGLKREAKATARLTHENILAVHDVGSSGNLHYFAMEYVDGNSLESLLSRGGALDEKRALSLVLQIARALDHAAELRVVHRDVKPSNILINARSVAKLCDFGFASGVLRDDERAGKGLTVGTPNYISPEQAQGLDVVDIRCDVYSLGATLYHAVTGSPPFTGDSPAEIMARHITEDPPPVTSKVDYLSNACAWFVSRMMEKDLNRRYHPMNLVKDLETWQRGEFKVPAAAFSDSSIALKALEMRHAAGKQSALGRRKKT